MTATVIAMFDSRDRAMEARDELLRNGFRDSQIGLYQSEGEGAEAGAEEPSFLDRLNQWLGFEESSYYQEGAQRGGTVVQVDVDDDRAGEQAADIMDRYGPMDVDVQAKQWQQEGWQPPTSGERAKGERASGEERVPLPEEELHVGKRRVQRGGVRIYTHVEEKPVEEQVDLTDEHVHVERRPTDRPADEDAFRERTVEASETHEEPVVEKEARVREEVVVNKEKEQHAETVRDTVRKTEAEVDESGRGGEDEIDREAYQFGSELAHDDRYRGRAFDNIEPEARDVFERRHHGDWSRYRDRIREGYERSRAA